MSKLPLLRYATGIFAFKKLFAYFYFRFMDGPEPMDAGCMVVAYPVINMFFLTFLFFAGNLFYLLPGGKEPLSLPNLLFLSVFVFLKLVFDVSIYIAQKYGDNT